MPRAFTLIELLVVITIIVVLLALLTPALDQAIYQAELAVCAARQDAMVGGVIFYTTSNRRSYPHRPGASDPNTAWQTAMIYNGNVAINALTLSSNKVPIDERPVLREFLDLNKFLNCPLTGSVDYEDLDLDTHAYAAYALWFGFRYLNQPGMLKLGDRLTWSSGGKTLKFNVLVSDRDVSTLGGSCQTTHPDDKAVMGPAVLQNGGWNIGAGSTATFKLTISTWRSDGRARGEVDLNYGYQDGSVRRVGDVEFRDSEMNYIWDWNNTHAPGWGVTMPND